MDSIERFHRALYGIMQPKNYRRWVDEGMVEEEEKDEEPAGTELNVLEVASSDEDDDVLNVK
eukprot:106847-Chlamydomonas_euryale.AAC.1